MPRAVDYRPLTDPVSPAEVQAFRQSVRTRPDYNTTAAALQIAVLVFVCLVIGTAALSLGVTVTVIVVQAVQSGATLALVGLLIPVACIGLFALFLWLVVRSLGTARWQNWYRLDRFAALNGLVFSPQNKDPQYPGSIFSNGHSRYAIDHFRSATDRFLDYGNYRYTTGSGKNQSTHTWGFLALALDRSLPHMVLDSKANNGLFGGSNIAVFDKDQILSLEGDFNNYFTLYCPKEYERDALYVFTPDLMALLIDTVAPFDVEIMDKWMFVYSAAPFDMRAPAVHYRLLSIVDTVGAKTLSQTDRYQDERVATFAANVVAPPGQRLKRRIPVLAIVLIVVAATFWLWPTFAGLLSAMLSR